MLNLVSYTTIILSIIIIVLLFFHVNYKKNTLLTTLNELFMFKKLLLNKKVANCAGKKIIISHLLFVSFAFLNTVVGKIYVSVCLYGTSQGMLESIGSEIYTTTDVIQDIFIGFIQAVILVLIIRLIYEFIVIPIALNNNRANMYQQNIYMQQAYQQSVNTPYKQQDYAVPPNQMTNISGSDNASPIQAEQQSNQTSTSPEIHFKFCSQCGTRYDATEDNCPNCGMK